MELNYLFPVITFHISFCFSFYFVLQQYKLKRYKKNFILKQDNIFFSFYFSIVVLNILFRNNMNHNNKSNTNFIFTLNKLKLYLQFQI